MNAKRKKPTAETGMLIRKPIDQAFEAFVDPGITTKAMDKNSTFVNIVMDGFSGDPESIADRFPKGK